MTKLERTTTWGTVAVAWLLLLLVGCQNPAEGKAVAQVSDPEPVRAQPAAPAQGSTFVISDGSTIGFTGSKVTGSHEGGFKAFTGSITLGEGGPTTSTVEVVIDTTSLWADNERLMGHLKSADFFDVETYPTARFSSTAITESDTGFQLAGELELHGVTKQISFPATIEIGAGQVTAKAEFVIKRFDFGIAFAGKPDDLIRDEVVVRLDLVGLPQAG